MKLALSRFALLQAAPALVLLQPRPMHAATARATTYAKLSNEEALRLEAASLTDPGTVLPSGIRVIDVLVGVGPQPEIGTLVYAHWKVWPRRFDGPPVDASYFDTRPSAWTLGDPSVVTRGPPYKPTASLPAGIDQGLQGMREGGWRRLVVPAALGFGEAGLPKGGRVEGYSVPPGADLYVDLRLMDGGSGRCDQLLRLEQVPKSISCKRGSP